MSSLSSSSSSGGGSCGAGGSDEIMLFGVRVRVDPMRKVVSLNNLSEYEHIKKNSTNAVNPNDVAGGYASADDAVPQNQSAAAVNTATATVKERKRGVVWSEEEHKLFLMGLEKVGKGNWKGISKNFVKTRTPTQVASHAQKYFLRLSNLHRRRRRSSLFDITADAVVTAMPMEKEKSHQDNATQAAPPSTSLPLPPPQNSNVHGFAVPPPFPDPIFVPLQFQNTFANITGCQGNRSTVLVRPVPVPIPVIPMHTSSAPVVFDMNQRIAAAPSPLSWGLSLSSFTNGDSPYTVA